MVDTRMVGVTDEDRAVHSRIPAHGLRTDLMKLATSPSIPFRTHLHSPSADSEGTEFFDALEEIPWTPDGPMHRSPAVMAVRRAQRDLWREGDCVRVVEESSRISAGSNESSAYTTSKVGGDDSLRQRGTGKQEFDTTTSTSTHISSRDRALNRTLSLRSLFPSRESMLKRESQRSISLPRLQVEPRPKQDEELVPNSVELTATEASASTGDGDGRAVSDSTVVVDTTVNDLEEQGEDASIASGTTISEEGWDSSGNGLEEVKEPALGIPAGKPEERRNRERGPCAETAAVAPIRISLRRVFESARSRTRSRQAQAPHKKGASADRRVPDGDPDCASNEIDSSATSPDGIPVLEEARDADVLSGGVETKAQSFFMKRGGKASGKGEGMDRPPEVKIHRHGRGTGRGDSWRSTHMVQCLRYHKGPVWTLEFNKHGTRMATGGEDGKVVVWDLAVPTNPEERESEKERPPSEKNNNQSREGAHPSQTDEDVHYTVDREGRPGIAVSTNGVGDRYLPTESESSASGLSDEAASLGRGSSDLGPSGDSRGGGNGTGLEVFGSAPARVFQGHKSDVVDLSWSHSDFLCSASIDHKVMLWHPLREERLGTFTHPDFVTSVHFHPLDDHIVLTGCFDKRLRLWTVPTGRVVNWVQCQEMISSARFTPDGQLAVAGLYDGRVIFHHTTDLRYYTQIHCRNRHGTNRRGKKVAGLSFVETSRLHNLGWQPCEGARSTANDLRRGSGEALGGGRARARAAPGAMKNRQIGMGKANNMSAQYSLLSTTNDSRLRIYDLDSFTMSCKFKGLVNDGIQIKASFSEDGVFVISGSEDGQVYLWNSKRGRTSAPAGVCPKDRLDACNGGCSVAAPSCSPGTAANAGTAAGSGRVKSRMSSSFSVQCPTRPKVATVAVFLPVAAIDAVLEGAAAVSPASANRLLRGEGSSKTEKRSRAANHNKFRRGPSMPPSKGADIGCGRGCGDHGYGVHQPSRRRWTFAGSGRFGGGAGRSLEDLARHQHQQQPGAALSAGKTKSGLLTPQVERAQTKAFNTGQPPGASSTLRPSVNSPENPTTRDMEHEPQAVEPLADAPVSESKAREAWRNPIRSSAGGKIRGIVSADYSGDVKVFLGFVDELDGAVL